MATPCTVPQTGNGTKGMEVGDANLELETFQVSGTRRLQSLHTQSDLCCCEQQHRIQGVWKSLLVRYSNQNGFTDRRLMVDEFVTAGELSKVLL